MEFESVLNPNASASGEVGALSAQFVIDRGVTAVISAQVGPKAQEVLNAAGVKIMAVVLPPMMFGPTSTDLWTHLVGT